MPYHRIAGVGAFVFAVLIVLTNLILVPAGFPSPGSNPEQAIEFFTDRADIAAATVALLPLAWLGSTLFASGILLQVWRAGRTGAHSEFGWALTGAAGVLLQNATFALVVALRTALATSADLDADTTTVVWKLHDSLFTLNGTFLAMALIGLSISGWRSRLVPSWHAVLGIVAGLLLLTSATLTPWVVSSGGPLGLIGLTGWVLWVAWLVIYATCLIRTPPGSRPRRSMARHCIPNWSRPRRCSGRWSYHGGMASVEEFRAAANRWDIAVPSHHRLPGVRMAGFRDLTTEPVELAVVPYPAVTLIIDLRDGQIVIEDVNGRRPSGPIVLGLAPGIVRGGGQDVEILQIRLSPVMAYAVVGGCAQLGGEVVALDDLWGPDGRGLQDRLRTAPSWKRRFAIAEGALAQRLEAGPAVDPEVGFVWRQMVATKGQTRVDELAGETGWSRKRLWSRFRSQIGLTPKRAAQLIRFDHAVHRLAAGQSAALVAAEAGYFDQSHLNREVIAFTGTTPSSVSVAPWLAVDDVAWAPGRNR